MSLEENIMKFGKKNRVSKEEWQVLLANKRTQDFFWISLQNYFSEIFVLGKYKNILDASALNEYNKFFRNFSLRSFQFKFYLINWLDFLFLREHGKNFEPFVSIFKIFRPITFNIAILHLQIYNNLQC